MNILIAIPCMDTVPTVFTQSLAMLPKVGNCAICMQVGSLVYDARNKLGKEAVRMGADLVFWLDSDMVFEPDTLVNMVKTLEEKKLDFLTGVYYRRREPYTPVLFDKTEIVEGAGITTEFDEIPESGLFEVGSCGFGCVLMRADVIFSVLAKYNDMFTPIGKTGEDIAFCWRARQCGYKIFADSSIKLGHFSQQIVTKDFYKAFKGAKHGTT
jgi:GT2 family glycosyltransferase